MSTLSIMSIASSGMSAAKTLLAVSAHNIANVNTSGFKRQEVVHSAVEPLAGVETSIVESSIPGPALEQDIINTMQATYSFKANLFVLRAADKMMGALLDMRV